MVEHTSAVKAAPPAESAPTARRCANCRAEVPGAYCGVCGQRFATRLVSVRRMVLDVLDDQLLVNSALPRTLGGLLFRPGFLTREYVGGRIVRYVAPFRLYLVSSLIFFLILTLLADPAKLGDQVDRSISIGRDSVSVQKAAAPRDSAAVRDSTAPRDSAGARPVSGRTTRIMNLGPLRDSTLGPAWWKPVAHRLAVQEDRINGMPKGEMVRGLISGLERNAPTAVFLLLPVYAMFLKVLYVRRKRLYVEHFVFALHIHAFTLLVLSVLLLTASSPVAPFLLLWLPVYAFLALRKVYGQGVLKTAAKFMVLGTSYVLAFCIGLVVTVMVAALTL